jgi:hypothetical protein
MSPKAKKELIKKRLSEGDKRSYNQIKADLELELWRERFQGNKYASPIVKGKQ